MIQQHLQMAMHKYLYDLLQDKYSRHSNVISRITHYMVTENDIKEFSQLISDLYESAYARALKDYHAQLESAGYKVALSYTSDK
jgi:uncharacterized glyoxalase superfamily metalloenzyme YdcJ